jgi:hypothetical protein
MHQRLQHATFHVEHVIPSSAGGGDDLGNLALACTQCNLHKSNRQSLPDPDSLAVVSLFNPRVDNWDDHFRWDGYRLVGRTASGRAMVEAFHLNDPRPLLIRRAEETFGLFPPS